MEALSDLLNGFATALTPTNLAWAALGVILGTMVGVLPGIGPAMTVALLLPVTYGLDPTAAFIMFAGIFYGGMFGGSTTSILLNTPGESSSVVTAIEGNLMARRGRASQALATAAIGSFVAGLIGTMLLVLLAPTIVDIAVGISAADYFAIMMLAFIAVTAVLGASRIRGFASLAIGLTIGLIGIDLATASSGSPSASPSWPTGSTSWWWPSGSSPSARPCGSPPTCAAGRPTSSRPAGRS
jgi:putative tricarboxylic transport membrane protein